ncbi:glycoside hydrolase family 16 protein [Rhizobiaceae bacterium n13]|uniref:Glycoside hydrolase family 16 protein n=1 Tax=Ferirhizobium litorale TaxID=2927786 RepID=A0AAE3QBD5_9HYPH|nr:glycoside hydrolase family 16 protein [Fererhizobium litorale]MDI7862061.1 glycoside hydrolase family 16 protein [Fererhizobium litorale]MDI7922667.1 glycoside hydrolase family 16 protein [Fererhizobium litorale]
MKSILRPQRLAVLISIALGLATPAFAQEGANGTSFVENFDRLDTAFWYVSDGWNNGSHQNCTWSKKQINIADGVLELTFDDTKAGDRDYACGEVQTRKRYGYGTYEARMKTADGSGLNSAFFTYIGPTDKKPHDEIDFEVLGKNSARVQLNQYVSAKGGNEKLIDVPGGANQEFNDYAFVWQKDRLRYYLNGQLVHEVADPGKLPVNAQKIFFSLWGTDTLKDWMGPFAYSGPTKLRVDRVAFTAEGDKCQFPGSLACTVK